MGQERGPSTAGMVFVGLVMAVIVTAFVGSLLRNHLGDVAPYVLLVAALVAVTWVTDRARARRRRP